jgi:hypothetical protein
MGKGGSVSVKEQTATDGDTLVNTGVVAWPDEDSALGDGTADAAQIASLGERGLGSPVRNGVVFTGASSVTVTRYRYRVANIPTPWTPTATSG